MNGIQANQIKSVIPAMSELGILVTGFSSQVPKVLFQGSLGNYQWDRVFSEYFSFPQPTCINVLYLSIVKVNPSVAKELHLILSVKLALKNCTNQSKTRDLNYKPKG
jgi:hypothetical protein